MIWFHISEAFKIFKRAALASIIAIISSTIAVMLVTISILFLFLSDTINERLKNQIELNIFLEDNITELQLDSLKNHLVDDKIVGYARFISKEDAVERFIEQTGEDFRSVLNMNPLPSSFVIRLKPDFVNKTNLEKTIDLYSGFAGVTEVKCDFETALGILQFIDKGTLIIYFLTSALILISLYFVYSTHKMWVLSKQAQFNTMKLVGAKVGTIKLPIILNGILIGLIAGSLCLFISFAAVNFLDKVYGVKILETYSNLFYLIILIGGFLGFFSSLLSTKGITLKIEQV